METAIHRAGPSVMRTLRGVKRSNCKQIWRRGYDPSEGKLILLLIKYYLCKIYMFSLLLAIIRNLKIRFK